MRLAKEQVEAARARLRALASTRPEPVSFSIQEAVTELLDELVAVNDAGHSLAAALMALNGDELQIAFTTLKGARKRALDARKVDVAAGGDSAANIKSGRKAAVRRGSAGSLGIAQTATPPERARPSLVGGHDGGIPVGRDKPPIGAAGESAADASASHAADPQGRRADAMSGRQGDARPDPAAPPRDERAAFRRRSGGFAVRP